MEQKLTSEEWIAEHKSRLSTTKKVMCALRVWRYKVQKGSDVWMMQRRPCYWNPLLWVLLVLASVMLVLAIVVSWPYVIVRCVYKLWTMVLRRNVVDCMSIDSN